MANQEHLDILRQGVEVWNKWRVENKEITPCLSNADLSVADLRGANLSSANLSGANLIGANLSLANLSGADLHSVNFRYAVLNNANLSLANLKDTILSSAKFNGIDLSGANLSGANLDGANLSGANLDGANLSHANLSGANLSGVNLLSVNLSHATLRQATLSGTNLSDAILSGAKFNGVDLSHVDLSHVDLSHANLSGADFSYATLSRANLNNANLRYTKFIGVDLSDWILSGANLSYADLSYANLNNTKLIGANLRSTKLIGANLAMVSFQTARLIDAKLDGANLTDACLWETQRAGWSIKGVICKSIYWDKEAKIKTSYSPGDFERLFAEKTRIRLFFKDGISPLEVATLPALIKHLEAAHPDCSLRLVSIHDDAGGAVVELAIEDDDQHSPEQMKPLQAALEAEAKQRIEYQRQALVEREARLQLEGEVKQLDSVVDKLIRHHTINIHQGGTMGDKYEISGQAGAVGPNAHAHDMTFNQLVNHVEQNIDLAELAKQLGELRQAMAQQQDSPQAAVALGEVAKAEIAATEKNTPKVVEHLKAAGKWTLDFAKDIGKDLVVDVIKKATGMP